MKFDKYNVPYFHSNDMSYTDNSGYVKYCHNSYNFERKLGRNGIFKLYRGDWDFNLIFSW